MMRGTEFGAIVVDARKTPDQAVDSMPGEIKVKCLTSMPTA